MTAAPSWLSTRPKSNLFIVRGGAAYALFTQPPAPDACEQHLVLFAPAGNRCGAIDLPSAQPGPCAAGGEIGQDGTVVVRGRLETYTNDPFPMNRQSYRFFPRLLQ
jgi:hypothetical protein